MLQPQVWAKSQHSPFACPSQPSHWRSSIHYYGSPFCFRFYTIKKILGIPDNDQSHAVELRINSPDAEALAKQLRSQHITYLILSLTNANWYVQYHDPHKYHQMALDYFENISLPSCGKSVYKDEGMELFEIICQ